MNCSEDLKNKTIEKYGCRREKPFHSYPIMYVVKKARIDFCN